ncbi:hypothetical protein, partial [Nitratireductor luteus]|uniref:hypothetical protein n=1 Tax=Nitratireductor luteus TaxID=2976980 RepID=UPI00223F6AF3
DIGCKTRFTRFDSILAIHSSLHLKRESPLSQSIVNETYDTVRLETCLLSDLAAGRHDCFRLHGFVSSHAAKAARSEFSRCVQHPRFMRFLHLP